MEKLKLLLIGILTILFTGCASYYMKFDNSSINNNTYHQRSRNDSNSPQEDDFKTVCDNCKIGGSYVWICGECRFCGATTGVRAIKLCRDCSSEHSLCSRCLKPI